MDLPKTTFIPIKRHIPIDPYFKEFGKKVCPKWVKDKGVVRFMVGYDENHYAYVKCGDILLTRFKEEIEDDYTH